MKRRQHGAGSDNHICFVRPGGWPPSDGRSGTGAERTLGRAPTVAEGHEPSLPDLRFARVRMALPSPGLPSVSTLAREGRANYAGDARTDRNGSERARRGSDGALPRRPRRTSPTGRMPTRPRGENRQTHDHSGRLSLTNRVSDGLPRCFRQPSPVAVCPAAPNAQGSAHRSGAPCAVRNLLIMMR